MTFKQASPGDLTPLISERFKYPNKTQPKQIKNQCSHHKKRKVKRNNRKKNKEKKNTKISASACVASTCSDKRFHSFDELFPVGFSEVSVGSARDTRFCGEGGRTGWCWRSSRPSRREVDWTETGQISSKAASTPSSSQSTALHWHRNQVDYSQVGRHDWYGTTMTGKRTDSHSQWYPLVKAVAIKGPWGSRRTRVKFTSFYFLVKITHPDNLALPATVHHSKTEAGLNVININRGKKTKSKESTERIYLLVGKGKLIFTYEGWQRRTCCFLFYLQWQCFARLDVTDTWPVALVIWRKSYPQTMAESSARGRAGSAEVTADSWLLTGCSIQVCHRAWAART